MSRSVLRYINAGAHIATNSNGVPNDSNQTHTERRFIASLDAGRYRHQPARGARRARRHECGCALRGSAGLAGGDTDFPYDIRTRLYRRTGDARLNFHIAPDVVVTGGGSYETQHERATGQSAQHRTSEQVTRSSRAHRFGALSYTGGVRVDHNSTFGNFTSYRAGAAYELPSATRVHAAVGTAFREPTFEESSSSQPFDVGNPDLRPERSRSWEAGVEQEHRARTGIDWRDVLQSAIPRHDPVQRTRRRGRAELLQPRRGDVERRRGHAARHSLRAAHASLRRTRTRKRESPTPGSTAPPPPISLQGQRLLRRPANLASVDCVVRIPATRNVAAPRSRDRRRPG